jgi:two-component system NtrC family sensor kinase
MRRGLQGWFSSLSFRLLIRLLGTMAVVFAVFAFVSYRTTSDRWTQTIYRFATRTSDLVLGSTHQGMMLNRKEDVHQQIRLIADSPGVAGIRIYDKGGKIIFSAKDEEIGQEVDMQAEACVACHSESEPLRSLDTENRTRVYRGSEGEHLLGVITPIPNQPQCANADCHAHPKDKSILGVLDVKMQMGMLDTALEDTRRQTTWLTLAMLLIVGVSMSVFVYRVVRKPVRRLYEGTQRIAAGDMDTRIEVNSEDEVGHLARAFNRMTGDLQQAQKELTDWSQNLEQQVAAKTDELNRIQRQIVQMEKMASLGKLSATVAHEINNPLAGILTYARLVERGLSRGTPEDEQRAEMQRHLQTIQQESRRCGDIVKNLLLFARQKAPRLALVHMDEVLERSIKLVRHHLQIADHELVRDEVPPDDELWCDADQIQQATLALLMNAIEAMGGTPGTLRVRIATAKDGLTVDITDSGCGIPDDVLPHIFEPFFSTKDKESGVGLGLPVVYGIVQRHGGQVDVTTQVGMGTTFSVRLPRRPPDLLAGAETPTETQVELSAK